MSNAILVTQFCKAGCTHCPFGKNDRSEVKGLETLIDEISSLSSSSILLSGGEPLEYPYIDALLKHLSTLGKFFRIATGGHVSIKPFISSLAEMRHFTGFSLGTDILISERQDKFRGNWIGNLKTLNDSSIHYSITITLGGDFILKILIEKLVDLNCRPDFFLLSELEHQPLSSSQWDASIDLIRRCFPQTNIKKGFIN